MANNHAGDVPFRNPIPQALTGVHHRPDEWPMSTTMLDEIGDELKRQTDAPAVGDINSDAKGTGARYSAGKVQMELLPLRVVARLLRPIDDAQALIREALLELGEFQSRDRHHDAIRRMLEMTAKAAGLTVIELLAEAAHVLSYGMKKYKAWNWAKGMPWSVCIGCTARHLLGTPGKPGMWQDPHSIDDESGRLHAGHVACNLLFLAQYSTSYMEGDDRPDILSGRPF